MANPLVDRIITAQGDTWRVVGAGAIDNSTAAIFLHLASTTRFHQQKNGKVPAQIADWFPVSLFDEVAA